MKVEMIETGFFHWVTESVSLEESRFFLRGLEFGVAVELPQPTKTGPFYAISADRRVLIEGEMRYIHLLNNGFGWAMNTCQPFPPFPLLLTDKPEWQMVCKAPVTVRPDPKFEWIMASYGSRKQTYLVRSDSWLGVLTLSRSWIWGVKDRWSLVAFAATPTEIREGTELISANSDIPVGRLVAST